MDEVVTKRQRELLTKARDLILKEPDGYDQERYGMGIISCNTPACIAGHIVASEPSLREELLLQLEGEDLSGSDGIDRIGSAIHTIACTALGTPAHPRVFRSAWPRNWVEENTSGSDSKAEETFVPTAADAVKVIGRILSGEIRNALRSGTTSASN